jgi:phage baseplate assembly protein W|tara:strand:- start:13574 stop:14077 length:504 start_codon:yes stop_codon:yes gene_type:complete
MAIKINNLNSKNNSGQTYIDLHLDLTTVQKDGGKGMSNNIVSGKDIVVDNDTTAIRNALINLMSTNKGQRPLSLGFGIDLYKFIGDPIAQLTAKAIGREIQRGIDVWEPRVTLKKVIVIPNVDALMYEVVVIVDPVALSEGSITLTGNLANEKGFNFVEAPLSVYSK